MWCDTLHVMQYFPVLHTHTAPFILSICIRNYCQENQPKIILHFQQFTCPSIRWSFFVDRFSFERIIRSYRGPRMSVFAAISPTRSPHVGRLFPSGSIWRSWRVRWWTFGRSTRLEIADPRRWGPWPQSAPPNRCSASKVSVTHM
jgi:hypothetical protein